MAPDDRDWPPRTSAGLYPNGTRRRGSTGQLWEVRDRRWVRVDDPDKGRLVPLHGSGPDDQ